MMNAARWWLAVLLIPYFSPSIVSQTVTLSQRIQTIMSRPEFTHSHFGIEIYSLDRTAVIYEFNPGKLMVPGSTTKLLTEGTVLEHLGGDYRFHTRVYR